MTKDIAILQHVQKQPLYGFPSSSKNTGMIKFHQKYFIESIPYEDENPDQIRITNHTWLWRKNFMVLYLHQKSITKPNSHHPTFSFPSSESPHVNTSSGMDSDTNSDIIVFKTITFQFTFSTPITNTTSSHSIIKSTNSNTLFKLYPFFSSILNINPFIIHY